MCLDIILLESCVWKLQNVMQAQKILGMTGLPVLCGVIKSEQTDREMLRGALECLNIAVGPSQVGLHEATR